MTPAAPNRGEVWWAELKPTLGHEQSGRRPAVVISVDRFNHGPSNLAIVLPMTRTARRIPSWVQVDPPEGGVTETSFVMCDQVRTIDHTRRLLGSPLGTLEPGTLERISSILKVLMQL